MSSNAKFKIDPKGQAELEKRVSEELNKRVNAVLSETVASSNGQSEDEVLASLVRGFKQNGLEPNEDALRVWAKQIVAGEL
ncbi:hypothetical protein [Herbiconiux daphne]|uniref:Uncharacterized protein n=1 Tax=Herbiconiux daphne TaxID=2970914 RepID=A0ABT2GZY5_9MICO|nr:hypothetical protein [Herbiconiux daphne]MCS5732386.1 hypothetical protein [Herbiconiux daphne]